MNWVKSRPGVRERLDREEGRLGIVVGERLGGVEHQLGVGHAEDVEHVLELDLRAAVGHELLERAERVAEAAGGGAREHAHRGVGQLDPLLARPRDRARRRSAPARAGGSRSGGSGPRSWPAPCGPRWWRARTPRGRAAPPGSSGRRSRRPARACAPRRGCRRACRPASGRAPRSRAARGCRPPSCSRRRPSRPRRARCRRGSPSRWASRDRSRPTGPPSALSAQASSLAIEVLPVPREPTNR